MAVNPGLSQNQLRPCWTGFKLKWGNEYFWSHNYLSVCVGLQWPSLVILMQKLTFLVLSNITDSNSCRICQTLASKGDITNISLVQQCRELEMKFGTNILQQCLAAPADAIYTAKSHLLEADWR